MERRFIRKTTKLVTLIERYRKGTLTQKHRKKLFRWVDSSDENEKLFLELLTKNKQVDALSIMANFKHKEKRLEEILKLPQQNLVERSTFQKRKIKNTFFNYISAAFILAFCVIGFYIINPNKEIATPTHLVAEISAGSNRAVLTLVDGSKIDLNKNQKGIIMDSGTIVYSDGSILSSDYANKGTNSSNAKKSGRLSVQSLILSTPKGGQYHITLSDGTEVWLNAASSLTYPAEFVENKRIVELKGEAYFEVSPDAKATFIVKSASQEIEVFGTQFNVMAYNDEPTVATTLLEGSVRVSTIGGKRSTDQTANSIQLKPNEQSLLGPNKEFQITKVNPAIAVSWKNDDFIFNNESLRSIMRKLARWYDVDIVYTKEVEDIYFSGMVSRSRNLSAVLEMLQSSEKITFKIDGREVKVMM